MVNNNDTEQYNKFIENLDLSKDCYNTETKQFNTFKLMMYGLNYKYLSMSVIYASVIAYILDFKQSFYVIYPLLWICAIIGTILIIFNWNIAGFSFLKLNCLKNDTTLKSNIITYLNTNHKNTFLAVRLFAILIHYIPIIYFSYMPILINYTNFKKTSNILIMFINMGIICIYGLLTNFNMYGNVDKSKYFLVMITITLILSISILPIKN